MQPFRPRLDALLAFIFIAAILVEGLILYGIDDAVPRLNLGLLVLAAAMWSIILAFHKLGPREPPFPARRRQYHQLRARVRDLLAEISRLNWLVVDAERGIRQRDAAIEEMDATEKRLHNLIVQVRSAAGQATPEFAAEQRLDLE